MINRHFARLGSDSFNGSVASLSVVDYGNSADFETVLTLASAVGIHFVVAAGNNADDACNYFPARLGFDSDIVTVGSTNVEDHRSHFSNYGPCIAVYAPGENIATTGPVGRMPEVLVSGTSFAVPHVSGLMAVFLSSDPTLRTAPDRMKAKIIDMALSFEQDELQLDSFDLGLLVNNGKDQRA